MHCPECKSTHIRKNGKRKNKQNHICVDCRRQFIDCYEHPKGYSDEVKRDCLKMYVNGMRLRSIERVKGVHHTTVITWIKLVGENLPDAYDPETFPKQVNLMNQKPLSVQKNKLWLWTAVDHFRAGILGWVLGDHSAKTFEPLWAIVGAQQCYFYVTDGWSVYPGFIPPKDQIVSKTYRERFFSGEMDRKRANLRKYLYSFPFC